MGEVGVHLRDQLGAPVERGTKAGDVGGADAFLAGAMQDLDIVVGGG